MIPVKNGTAPGTPIAVGVNSILYKFFHFDTAYAVSLTCVHGRCLRTGRFRPGRRHDAGGQPGHLGPGEHPG